MINPSTINHVFLKVFLNNLAQQEPKLSADHPRHGMPRRRHCQSVSQFDIDKFKIDNLQFRIKDIVQLGVGETGEWKQRYYQHYFQVDDVDSIDNICSHFLDGLLWVSQYYLRGCCSWRWSYPFEHGPCISDINSFFDRNDNYYNGVEFELGQPVKPHIQLLSVLHPACCYLLPKKLQYLMKNASSPIIDMYPYHFEEDLIGQSMLWECVPILPYLDIRRIEAVAT